MKTLCLDFDGVIHSYVSGWKGPRVIPDPPVPGALCFMLDMLNADWDVAIHSSRSGHWGGRWAMRSWLRHHAQALWHEVPAGHGLEEVRFPLFKPPAFVTLDDRALTFKGAWPTPAELAEFKPWKLEGAHERAHRHRAGGPGL